MTFLNQAALSYHQGTIYSNTVAGELVSTLSLTKSASAASYAPSGQLQYTLTVANTAPAAYTGLTLLDDLGSYDFMGGARFPLAYVDGSASLTYYSAAGISAGTAAVQQTAAGIVFTLDVPGSTIAVLRYNADITVFAPLAAGSTITNAAVLSGAAPLLPLQAALSLPAAEAARLTIAKCAPFAAVAGQVLTFSFILSNYGNTAVTGSDYTILSDTLDPPLTGVTVYADGAKWTKGVQYEYDETLFFFQTQPGAITLDAAGFSQDSFGRWVVTPASQLITVSGTVAG